MGNVNEAASETAHSGGVNTKELPGALQTSQEDDATNSEALTVGVRFEVPNHADFIVRIRTTLTTVYPPHLPYLQR
jgi:hypothetical protein